ncbi:DNA-3-methyladenine glycosylase [[Clostridium] cellulosi]
MDSDRYIMKIDINAFDPDVTFDCGQCFRWDKIDEGIWKGIALGRSLEVKKDGDWLCISGAEKAMEPKLRKYFDLDRDYKPVLEALSADPVLKKAIKFAPGIRILRQEPWETLCSFIISQNNNIPRIKGIVSRLCENFGDKIGENEYSFPEASRLAPLNEEDLAPLRSGFRARYILDAARRVVSGEIDFDALTYIPLADARKILMKIKGVGPKVADCVLLFGCGRLDAFPIDVWVKRVLARFYPNGFPEEFAKYGGIAQQFLFHYARCCPDSGF